jgi:hypothetical protein
VLERWTCLRDSREKRATLLKKIYSWCTLELTEIDSKHVPLSDGIQTNWVTSWYSIPPDLLSILVTSLVLATKCNFSEMFDQIEAASKDTWPNNQGQHYVWGMTELETRQSTCHHGQACHHGELRSQYDSTTAGQDLTHSLGIPSAAGS